MRKLLLLMTALLTLGVSGAWAALSSNTIAKSGNVTDTWYIASSMPTNDWILMATGVPSAITSDTPYYKTQDITLSDEGALSITFQYTSGSHRLDILGVDLLNSNDEVVRSDYHSGYTGTNRQHNVYMLDHIAAGNYKIRFIIDGATVSSSAGNITIKHINIKTADSYAAISHWYFVRMHSNQTHYMYYSGTSIGFSDTKANDDKYLWGFVKDIDGVRIFNKAAGSAIALDNAEPCNLSADGLSQTFTFFTGNAGDNGAAAGAYFSLYKITNSANNYLNYRTNNTIQRWSGNDEGSTLMIDEAPIAGGKIYTVQAYFSNDSYSNRYFSNNEGTLAFITSAANGVKDFWILRSSGNATYPWKLESGRGDGKFLSPEFGLSTTGGYVQINNCTSITSSTYFHLYGGNNDAAAGDIRYLGTWSPDFNQGGFARTGQGGCWGSGHHNDTWTTDYIIEEVPDVDLYTVISGIDEGGVTYTPSYTGVATQTNGGFYILASAPSASDFTAKEVTNYTPGAITVDATAKTITVNYTANITYTLTDMNGATYSWSASGNFGTAPTLTGCDGYALSNEVWNEESRTYTADITFLFPVSSNNVTNWTYIGNFANSSNNYATSRFCWFVKSSDATKVYSGLDKLPTNQSGEQEKWEWSITPTFTAGAFSFTIKNASTNKYVTMAASPTAGFSNQISLTDIGTAFTFDASHRWKLPTATELYISQNSSSATEQEVGVYGPIGAHGAHSGNYIAFITPADFTSLMSELKAARTSFNNYFLYWSQEKYTEAVEGTMASTYNKLAEDRNVVKDPPTEYFTAAQFKTYTDAYKNAVAGLSYVMPTFFRVKNLDGTKYAKTSSLDYANYVQLDFSAGGNDATSIFYLNASNNIMSYYSGLYLFAMNHTCPVSWTDWKCSYEFLQGSAAGQIYVHVVSNPSGWGGEEKYWSGAGDKMGRVVTPTADSDLLIEEVTSLPVTFKGQFASFFSPVDLTLADGVKAYTGKLNGDNTILTLTKVDYVPANTGVILEYEAFSSETTLNFPILSTVTPIVDTSLTGATAAQNVAADSKLVLGKNDEDKWGIYSFGGSILGGFKAYMDKTNSVKGFTFTFGDADAIANVLSGEEKVNEVYDLSGRRVNVPARGLYIVNGKKVVIK